MLIDLGNTALDQDHNLEWLNFTETLNESYYDTLNEFGTGGKYEGWRFALESDVRNLFLSAGAVFTETDDSFDPTEVGDAAKNILNALNSTSITSFSASVSFSGTLSPELAGFYVGHNFVRNRGLLTIEETMFATGDAERNKSLALVRDYTAVPAPTTLALFGLGLGFIKRKRAA